MKELIIGAILAFVPTVERPPERYQHGAAAVVLFMDTDMDVFCQSIGGVRAPDQRIVACAKGRVIYLPNPCRVQETYAQLACHEMAHINGWTHQPEPSLLREPGELVIPRNR